MIIRIQAIFARIVTCGEPTRVRVFASLRSETIININIIIQVEIFGICWWRQKRCVVVTITITITISPNDNLIGILRWVDKIITVKQNLILATFVRGFMWNKKAIQKHSTMQNEKPQENHQLYWKRKAKFQGLEYNYDNEKPDSNSFSLNHFTLF